LNSDKSSYNVSTSFKRAFGTLIPLMLLSLLLSALILSVANDMYAFVKKDRDVRLSFSEPSTIDEFSKQLKASGILKNPNIFKLYVISKGKQELLENFCGEIELNSNFSYRQILNQIQSAQNNNN